MRITFLVARACIASFLVGLLITGAFGQSTAKRVKPKMPTVQRRLPVTATGRELKAVTWHSALPIAENTSASTHQQWVTLLSENFESGFPETNNWRLLWDPDVRYTWDDDGFKPHSGARSAWCAGRSDSPQFPDLDPATDDYPNNLNAWMAWGPFNLADAIGAELQFWYWNDSEEGYDFFSVGGSLDNNDYFFQVELSGNSNGWQFMNFNLNSLSGQPQVWIAFKFFSDDTVNAKGVFVDDIVLRKMTAGTAPTITHQPVTAGTSGTDLPITATISDNEAITAKLFYRPGGASTYKNIAMTANANTFTGVVPVAEVTSRGLEYYISAADGQSTTYDPPSNFETNPHRIRVRTANLTKPEPQPGGSAQTAYRMISIPAELDQTQVDAVLVDDLGVYDDTRWRFFRFEDGNFVEFPDPKAAAFAPGKAFWLIVQEANKTIDAG